MTASGKTKMRRETIKSTRFFTINKGNAKISISNDDWGPISLLYAS